MKRMFITIIGLFCFTSLLIAQEQEEYIKLKSKGIKNWSVRAFVLDKDMILSIVATGQTIKDHWAARAWIIDAETRRPVWVMDEGNSRLINKDGRMRFMGDLKFNAGAYELYFGVDPSVIYKSRGFSKFIDDLFDNLDHHNHETKHWNADIKPLDDETQYFHELSVEQIKKDPPALELVRVGDNSVREAYFTLEHEQNLRIYMVGEGMRKRDRMYDYGWITNLETRQRVWQADVQHSEHAGGADKNRLIDTIISLPKGNYSLNYITDDSHSPDMFNQMPPWDPMSWGIKIYSKEGSIKADPTIKKSSVAGTSPVVRFDRVGNDAFFCEGFEIFEPTRFHIVAMGEYTRMYNGFVDHGWIINARNRRIVWDMTKQNTYHAGGSQKNKRADETIELGAGAYKVYYVTDDSHAYGSWNSSPPLDPEYWGIAVYPVGDKEDLDIRPYDENNDPAVIASLKQIGDDEYRRKPFTLDKDTFIRIYALGEGDSDEMYDYGWIEDASGRTVWKMNYGITNHAGGAHKNRLVNKVIELEAGDYTLFYVSDDSHSFRSWNSARPDDYSYWGITLFRKDME